MLKKMRKNLVLATFTLSLLAIALFMLAPSHHSTTSKIIWPPNDGFSTKPPPQQTTLRPGTLIDRYGSAKGKYAAPRGTPFALRSLPCQDQYEIDRTYEVRKPFQVEAGKTAPWFGEPGGGIQYELPASVQTLVTAGYLQPVG